eukprot:GHVU01033552.1.p2 GENE.GHVU01033552.1~~GHVU01033552.1.p2  ORF type:complete len:114 (+),score=12.15 GHVU01033552.1:465-806(+)
MYPHEASRKFDESMMQIGKERSKKEIKVYIYLRNRRQTDDFEMRPTAKGRSAAIVVTYVIVQVRVCLSSPAATSSSPTTLASVLSLGWVDVLGGFMMIPDPDLPATRKVGGSS